MRPIDARRLTGAKRRFILDRDDNRCMYCLEEADEVDHIVPWSYLHDDSAENLISACWLCNHIASNKLFDTLQEKKAYIVKRKNLIIKKTVIAIWMEDELEDMGPAMQRDIKSQCLVFSDKSSAFRTMRRFKDIGMEVVMGDWVKIDNYNAIVV